MLNDIFIGLLYLLFSVIFFGYSYFSIDYLVENNKSKVAHTLNIILILLLLLVLIFARDYFVYFITDNFVSTTNFSLIFSSLGIFLRTVYTLSSFENLLVLFLVVLIIIVFVIYIVSFKVHWMIYYAESFGKQCEQELHNVKQSDKNKYWLLQDKDKELEQSKNSIDLLRSNIMKYEKFYNLHQSTIKNLANSENDKDKKIKDLEEIIKRRDLQIQRMKKSRKDCVS